MHRNCGDGKNRRRVPTRHLVSGYQPRRVLGLGHDFDLAGLRAPCNQTQHLGEQLELAVAGKKIVGVTVEVDYFTAFDGTSQESPNPCHRDAPRN